jgi:23S rRNA (guanosine2251-2'-O)-methyltransferase
MNLVCGINPVLEALAAGTRHFERVLIVKGLRNRRVSEAIARASRLSVPLRFETRETLDRMAGGVPHQGIIAVVSARPALTLDGLFQTVRDPALFVVLDGVEDPRNLGAILRTAEAAGADGVLLPERHSAGLSETVNRASAGALEHVRVARVGNVVQALTALKARGVWVVGFDAGGTERWDQVDMKKGVALVLGGEGRGIRRLVREHCDHLVSIPLFGHVGSLNVSVAAGIALYEVVRQRGAMPSHVRPIPAHPSPPSRIVGPQADDAERDPGAAPWPAWAGEGEALEEDQEAGEPIASVVEFQEESAWAGPTVLKPAGFARDPRRMDRGRGRRSRPTEPGSEAPGRPPRDKAAGEPGAAGAERGRRRRKGRRGRDGGSPGGGSSRPASGPPRDALPRPPEGGPPEGGSPAAGETGPDGAGPRGEGPAGPGRRRRRRRRRR